MVMNLPTFKATTALIIGSLICLTVYASAATANTPIPIKPFTAHYASTWDVGLKIGGKAIRQLQLTNDGNWQFSLSAKALVAKLNEQSLLSVKENQLLPLHYQYQRKILNNQTDLSIDFDWQQGKATTHSSNSWTMPISAPLQDKLSVQLQLQRDLALAKQINTGDQLSYEVAAGGQIEAFNYRVIGTETLDTPMGTMEAIKIERLRSETSNRLTYIWFAPKLDFHVVRILQQEPDGKQYLLDLQELNY
jgi:hypothetical protein